MTSLKTSVAILLVLSLTACKVGPNYKRPATTVPDQYRGIASERLIAGPRASPLPIRLGPRFTRTRCCRPLSKKL